MNPILFESTENIFDTNGIGILADAIFCEVTYERNGILELEMQYPITGIHYKEIKTRNIILASPNPVENTQPFRIYRITKPINGIITIYSEHISYDLSGIPVSPFTAGSAAEAMSKLQSSAAIESPFTFWTDKETVATMSVVAPASTRSLLGGQQGSVLDVYGGEYQFDRYTVRLYNQRGMNRGVSIRYGKNLTSLEQDENISSVYTGVYPYWMDTDNNLVTLPEKILNAPGTYNFTRIMALDLSQEFESAPTEEQLRNRANTYMTANNIGVPKVSLDVSFIQLEQTEEYKNIALLERVELCDTVNVEFPELGVSATAKCVKTVYDVLQERYTSVELGEARTNIADTIADQQQKIEKAPTTSAMQKAINNATNWLTSADGYVIAVKDDNGTWKEILFLDTPSAETAKNVLRINTNGIGFSTNGVNGPYRNAWTIDGSLVADFITTGVLTANLIKAGVLQSLNGASSINMETGEANLTGNGTFGSIKIGDGAGNIAGEIFAEKSGKTYLPYLRMYDESGNTALELSMSGALSSDGSSLYYNPNFKMFDDDGNIVFNVASFRDQNGKQHSNLNLRTSNNDPSIMMSVSEGGGARIDLMPPIIGTVSPAISIGVNHDGVGGITINGREI
jgi:phage minor structural protein